MSASENGKSETKASGRSGGGGGSAPPQFIQYRLSDEEMDQAKNAADTYSDIGEIFTQLIDEGYKVSASHDNYGGGVQVFLTPQLPKMDNWGYTLTGRAPTLLAAVAVIAWKHYTLFTCDWPKGASDRKGGSWG